MHLFEALMKKNNRGSMQCNLDLCNCKEPGSKDPIEFLITSITGGITCLVTEILADPIC